MFSKGIHSRCVPKQEHSIPTAEIRECTLATGSQSGYRLILVRTRRRNAKARNGIT